MMRKLAPIFFVLWLFALTAQGQTINLQFNFSTIGGQSNTVRRITINALGAIAPGSAAQLPILPDPIVLTAFQHPEMTNGSVTVSNYYAGWVLQEVISTPQSTFYRTNAIGTNLTGTVDVFGQGGVVTGYLPDGELQFAYFVPPAAAAAGLTNNQTGNVTLSANGTLGTSNLVAGGSLSVAGAVNVGGASSVVSYTNPVCIVTNPLTGFAVTISNNDVFATFVGNGSSLTGLTGSQLSGPFLSPLLTNQQPGNIILATNGTLGTSNLVVGGSIVAGAPGAMNINMGAGTLSGAAANVGSVTGNGSGLTGLTASQIGGLGNAAVANTNTMKVAAATNADYATTASVATNAAAGGNIVTNSKANGVIVNTIDPYHIYVSGLTTNPLISQNPYTWVGPTNAGLGCSSGINLAGESPRTGMPAWTNANGYMIYFSVTVNFGENTWVLTTTNPDFTTQTNLYWDTATSVDPIWGFAPIAKTWDNAGWVNNQPVFSAPFPTITFGTNIVVNTGTQYSSQPNSSRIIRVDGNGGSDIIGAVDGFPFKTIQVAQAFSHSGDTWKIEPGNYDLTWFGWEPTNATIDCSFGTVFSSINPLWTVMCAPQGNLTWRGGYFYRNPTNDISGPSPIASTAGFGPNVSFTDLGITSSYGCYQGGVGMDQYLRFVNCNFYSSSYGIEIQGSSTHRVYADIIGCKVVEGSWNPSQTEGNMEAIAGTLNAEINISGCTIIVSNSFPNGTSTTPPSGILVLNAGTNVNVRVAGTVIAFQGTNTDGKYITCPTNVNGNVEVWGYPYPTNLVKGSVLFHYSQDGSALTNVSASTTTTSQKTASAVTLTGSVFTFSNATPNVLECFFSGGTAYSVTKNGVAVYGSLVGDGYFLLQPTNRCAITYTVAPTFYTNQW